MITVPSHFFILIYLYPHASSALLLANTWHIRNISICSSTSQWHLPRTQSGVRERDYKGQGNTFGRDGHDADDNDLMAVYMYENETNLRAFYRLITL